MAEYNANAVREMLPDYVTVEFTRRWHGRYRESGASNTSERHEHFEGDEVSMPRPLAARLRNKGIVDYDGPLTVQDYWQQHLAPGGGAEYETKTVDEIEDAVSVIRDRSALEELLEREQQGKDRKTAKDAIRKRLQRLEG